MPRAEKFARVLILFHPRYLFELGYALHFFRRADFECFSSIAMIRGAVSLFWSYNNSMESLYGAAESLSIGTNSGYRKSFVAFAKSCGIRGLSE